MVIRWPATAVALALSVVALSARAQQGEAADPDAPKAAGETAAVAEARVRYKRAIDLYNNAEFKLALIELKRAYELAPHWKIHFNIGQVNLQLNNYAAAKQAFERYLEEGGERIDAKRRAAVQKELDALVGRTAKLGVTSNVSGAEVRVDGRPVGETPLDPLLIDAGEHNITVTKEGRSSTKYVMLAGAEEVVIDIQLGPLPTQTVPVPVPVPDPSGARRTGPGGEPGPVEGDEPVPGWVAGWVVTGALAAGAIGVGVAALLERNALADERKRETNAGRLRDMADKARALSITADALTAAAVVSGAVTLYFTIDAVRAEQASAGALRVGVGPAAFQLSGSF